MMKFQDHSAGPGAFPSNVVAFPRVSRSRATLAPRPMARAVAITAADVNARLLVLLGICLSGATIALLAVHILHG